MKLMIIVAHPDDEVLGCGGTIARLINEGSTGKTLILCDGISSRDIYDPGDIMIRKRQSEEANKILGINEIVNCGLPDQKLDTIPLLEVIKLIEQEIKSYKPNIIFTHFRNDLNKDHRIVYEAVLTATRPMQGQPVKTIYSFEVASSTEWNYPLSFIPDTYFDITKTMIEKQKALAVYSEELRDYPHPRSIEGIELQAQYWDMRTGGGYKEAFVTVRNFL